MPPMKMPHMWMYFHTEPNDLVLFKFWKVTTTQGAFNSCYIYCVYVALACFRHGLELCGGFRCGRVPGAVEVRALPAGSGAGGGEVS